MNIIKFPNKLKETWFKKAINENCTETKKLIINSYLYGENGFDKDISQIRILVNDPFFGLEASTILFEYLKSNEEGILAINNDPKRKLEIKKTFDERFLNENPSEINKDILDEVNKKNDNLCIYLMDGIAYGINGIKMNHSLLFDIYWAKENPVIPKYIMSFCFKNPIDLSTCFDDVIDTITACRHQYLDHVIANI